MSKTRYRRINAYDVIQGWMETRKADCEFDGESRKDYQGLRGVKSVVPAPL